MTMSRETGSVRDPTKIRVNQHKTIIRSIWYLPLLQLQVSVVVLVICYKQYKSHQHH